jgi:hypothetical protein
MSPCAVCHAQLVPGALLCPSCGTPAGLAPAGAAPSPAVAVVVPFAPVASAPRGHTAIGLAPVENGTADPSRALSLPVGDFSLRVGRHDLTATPPHVVDVDLTSFAGPVQLPDGSRGFPFSRRHATLARVAGALTLTPSADATTFVRRAGEPDFAPLAGGTSRVLEVGTRVVFGTHRPLIVEVV